MYSTVKRPYQGILSSQNVTQFYGKHINVILFAPTRKAQIFMCRLSQHSKLNDIVCSSVALHFTQTRQ